MMSDYTTKMFTEALNKILSDKMVDGERIEQFLDSDILLEMYREFIKSFSDTTVDTIEEIMYEKVMNQRSYTNEFIARMEQKWCKAFVASEALYICIMESSDENSKYVFDTMNGKKDDRIPLYNSLVSIHARACQEYLEIVCLCKNGFADGAYARWRSLYELSVMSNFIRNNNEQVASAFLDAADGEERYDWARCADCFKSIPNRKHITFAMIQNEGNFSTEEWKKQYVLANKLVHASPQGTIYRIGNKIDTNVLSAGHSDYGVTLPLVQSAISVVAITSDLFTLFPCGDNLSSIMTFRKWIERIESFCNKIEKECFNDGIDEKENE